MKGEDIKSNRLCEPIADTNIEGAKSTILYHWEQAKNSEKNNLYHHYQTAKAIYSAKESFCKSDEQTISFSKFSKIADYLPGMFIRILRSQNGNL